MIYLDLSFQAELNRVDVRLISDAPAVVTGVDYRLRSDGDVSIVSRELRIFDDPVKSDVVGTITGGLDYGALTTGIDGTVIDGSQLIASYVISGSGSVETVHTLIVAGPPTFDEYRADVETFVYVPEPCFYGELLCGFCLLILRRRASTLQPVKF